MKIEKYVGLDVHKDKTTVAIAESDRTGEVRAYGEISSDLVTTEKPWGRSRASEACSTLTKPVRPVLCPTVGSSSWG